MQNTPKQNKQTATIKNKIKQQSHKLRIIHYKMNALSFDFFSTETRS